MRRSCTFRWPLTAGFACLLTLSANSALSTPVGTDDEVESTKVLSICTDEGCDQQVEEEIVVRRKNGKVKIRRSGDTVGHHGFLRRVSPQGARLGVALTDLTPELRAHFGAPEDQGALVAKVLHDSPAFRAGVVVGDVLTAVNGQPMDSARSISRALGALDDGETAELEVWRDGQVERLSAGVETNLPSAAHSSFACKGCQIDYELDYDTDQFGAAAAACGDAGECRVTVECEDGDCSCTVNGEEANCEALQLSSANDPSP